MESRPAVRAALRRLAQLQTLPEGWDSYQAKPISVAAIRAATKVVESVGEENSVPHIVPLASGGLQLEWTLRKGALELQVSPEGELYVD